MTRRALLGAPPAAAPDTDVVHAAATNTVAEAASVVVNRPTLVTPGTAADVWQFTYNGTRAGYANEYGCLRSRSPVANQYAFRAQSHASAGATQAIGSFATSDNTDQFVTLVNGDSYVTRDLRVGRNVVFGSTATMVPPTDWVALPLGAGLTDIGNPTYYTAASRREPFDVVRLRGRISFAGSLAGNATLFTLDAAHRPAYTVTFSVRTGPSSNLATVMQILSTGVAQLIATTGSGGYLGLDGISFYAGT